MRMYKYYYESVCTYANTYVTYIWCCISHNYVKHTYVCTYILCIYNGTIFWCVYVYVCMVCVVWVWCVCVCAGACVSDFVHLYKHICNIYTHMRIYVYVNFMANFSWMIPRIKWIIEFANVAKFNRMILSNTRSLGHDKEKVLEFWLQIFEYGSIGSMKNFLIWHIIGRLWLKFEKSF